MTARITRARQFCRLAAAVIGGMLAAQTAQAQQDATWLAGPANGDFNTAANWSTGTEPTGVASFGASGTTGIAFTSATTTLGAITFNAGAPAYTFTWNSGVGVELTGAGIVNNSSSSHSFDVGDGALTFSGPGTAGNAKITSSGGQLNFFGSSSAGTATILNTNGSILSFDDSSTAASATITNSAGAFMCFCNDATPGDANITNTGSGSTLMFSNNPGAGNATITNSAGATVSFVVDGTVSTARYISSAGILDVSSLGTVAIGSIEGDGTVDLGGAALTVGGNNRSTAYSGVIDGGGSLIKTGTGTLTLGGIDTYTGGTTVSQGGLAVTGSLMGDVAVSSSGTLGGTGTIFGNVTNGGTVAPGTAGAALTISGGNYAQTSGSIFQVAITPTAASSLVISGTATLAGTLSVQAASGAYHAGSVYTVLTATGGRSGVFSDVTATNNNLLLAFLTPALTYDANDVFVTLVQDPNAFVSGAQNANQRAVGAVLDRATLTATGDFAKVLSTIVGLDTTQGPQALDMIGGQNYSGFAAVAVQSAQIFMTNFAEHVGGGGSASTDAGFSRVMLADACAGPSCDMTNMAAPARWGAWGGAIGGVGTVAGDAGSHGLNYDLGGFAAGLDYRFDPQFLAGITIGYTSATQNTQGMAGRGTSDTVQGGLYGSFTEGPIYLDGLAGYARGDNSMQRPIIISGLPPRTALGHTAVDQFFGMIETGYKIGLRGAADAFVTPFARLQGSTATQDAFSESGANSLDLTVAAQTTNSLRSVLGAQLGGSIDAGWRDRLAMVLRLGWSHEFADTSRPVTASFAGAPTLSFTTLGAAAPRDGAVIGLGADTKVAEATSLYLRYDGDLEGGDTSNVLSAGVRVRW